MGAAGCNAGCKGPTQKCNVCSLGAFVGLFPAKEVEVEVISEEILESSGALCTGLQKGRKLTFVFEDVLLGRDREVSLRQTEKPGAGKHSERTAMSTSEKSTAVSVGEPMAEGAFKYAYAVRDKKTRERYVLKATKKSLLDSVWDDLEQSIKAIEHATTFNDMMFGSKIRFCAPSVVSVMNAKDAHGETVVTWLGMEVLLEPMLEGIYTKFVYSQEIPKFRHDLPQAYFHYTFNKSNKQQIIWDLQGVDKSGMIFSEYHLTDPLVLTDAEEAALFFKALHTDHWGCNHYCSELDRLY